MNETLNPRVDYFGFPHLSSAEYISKTIYELQIIEKLMNIILENELDSQKIATMLDIKPDLFATQTDWKVRRIVEGVTDLEYARRAVY